MKKSVLILLILFIINSCGSSFYPKGHKLEEIKLKQEIYYERVGFESIAEEDDHIFSFLKRKDRVNLFGENFSAEYLIKRKEFGPSNSSLLNTLIKVPLPIQSIDYYLGNLVSIENSKTKTQFLDLFSNKRHYLFLDKSFVNYIKEYAIHNIDFENKVLNDFKTELNDNNDEYEIKELLFLPKYKGLLDKIIKTTYTIDTIAISGINDVKSAFESEISSNFEAVFKSFPVKIESGLKSKLMTTIKERLVFKGNYLEVTYSKQYQSTLIELFRDLELNGYQFLDSLDHFLILYREFYQPRNYFVPNGYSVLDFELKYKGVKSIDRDIQSIIEASLNLNTNQKADLTFKLKTSFNSTVSEAFNADRKGLLLIKFGIDELFSNYY